MAIQIEAHYRLTTPLFCGGAVSSAAELRLPSFKGVLRFWWRALAWSRCEGNLALIQQQEDLLFGSATGGQARVVMRLGSISRLDPIAVGDVLKEARGDQQVVGMGARYLGYGLMAAFPSARTDTQAGQLSRGALQAPLQFTVQLRSSGLDPGLLDSLLQALIALGTFGGMGSRSRKGYGSLVIESLTVDGESPRLTNAREPWSAPRNALELAGSIAELQQQANRKGLPEYTALSSSARHVVLTAEDCRGPLHLLDLVGREMVRYRSWGKDGKVLRDIPSEKNFRHDHDLMKKRSDQRRAHPERIAFGLPHNYGQGRFNEVSPAGLDRRASPLFIHIHSCASGPVAVLSFLPARFLPASGGSRAQIDVGNQTIPQKPEQELYQPVHAFLDRLLNPSKRKEPFTTPLEVTP